MIFCSDAKKDEPLTRSIEFLVYFDRTDSGGVPLNPKKTKEHKLIKEQAGLLAMHDILKPAAIERGRAFWVEALRNVYQTNNKKRFFSFYGKDEYSGSKLHFEHSVCMRLIVSTLPLLRYSHFCIVCVLTLDVYSTPFSSNLLKAHGTTY